MNEMLPPAALGAALTAVERALRPVLESGRCIVPADAVGAIEALVAQARAAGLAHIAETARAMLAFIAAMDDEARARPESCVQLAAMLDALAYRLQPQAAVRPVLLPLLRKPAAGPRRGQLLCLLLDSKSVALSLDANLRIAGFEVESIHQLDELACREAARLPAAILADLSLLRATPAAREAMERVRATMPEVHLFCLSSSYDFDSRLERFRQPARGRAARCDALCEKAHRLCPAGGDARRHPRPARGRAPARAAHR